MRGRMVSMFFASGLILGLASMAQGVVYEVDTTKSSVKWTGSKVVAGSHYGTIQLKSGSINLNKENKPEKGTLVVDMSTIKVEDIKVEKDNKKLTDHLNSPDFFGVEKFKEAKLVVSKIELVKDKTHKVEGTLTIKNLSHPVTFPVEVEAKGDEMTAKGKLTFDRSLFDVRYGSGKFNPDLLKDKLISDNVDLEFTLVTKKTQSKS